MGRKKWKRRRKYHRRSLAETAIMRVKRIFGDRLSAKRFLKQATEMFVRWATLKKMRDMGKKKAIESESNMSCC